MEGPFGSPFPDERLTHEPAAGRLVELLRPWARHIAVRFGAPVYLVGSSLELPDPRDVDVRVILSDDAFRGRYGDPDLWCEGYWWPTRENGIMRYAADMWDLSREASLVYRLNIDFAVQPEREAARHEGARIRIDDLV